MDQVDKLWALFWKCVAAVLSVAVVSMAGCSINKDDKVAEMVKSGADPIAAACAVGRDGYAMVCAVQAANK